MSDDSSSLLEEERSLFRPFTRESLIGIEARIAEELEKQKELEKRRAEGEVNFNHFQYHYISLSIKTKTIHFPI
jgi:voltage-gated sodium channel type II alpha